MNKNIKRLYIYALKYNIPFNQIILGNKREILGYFSSGWIKIATLES